MVYYREGFVKAIHPGYRPAKPRIRYNMPKPNTIRIEITPPIKGLIPWTVTHRRGRQHVDTQCFALLGYPEQKIGELSRQAQEMAQEYLENALRHLTAFEYIPPGEEEMETFFERKILAFEKIIEGIPSKAPPLHVLVGVTQGTRVLFASSGEIVVLQISPSRILNLNEASEAEETRFDAFRSGNLNSGSSLLITPKTMAAFLKSDELKQISYATSAGRKLEYFEHLWQKRSTLTNPFRAILLEVKPKLLKTQDTTAISIGQLLDTEARTEALLSPPLLRPLVTRGASALVRGSRLLYRRLHELKKRFDRVGVSAPHLTVKDRLPSAVKSNRHSSASAPIDQSPTRPAYPRSLILPRLYGLYRAAAGFKISFKRRLLEIPRRITARAKAIFSGSVFIERFNLLPRKSRLILIFGIIFIFIFAQGILLTRRNGMIARAEIQLKEATEEIQNLIDDANAALIYDDEEKARRYLEDAQARIENLPEYQKNVLSGSGLRSLRNLSGAITSSKLDELAALIQPLKEKLRRAVEIQNPDTVAQFEDATLAPLGLARIGGRLAVYDSGAFAVKNGSVTEKFDIAFPEQNAGAIIRLLPLEDPENVVLILSASAYIYDLNAKTLSAAIPLNGAVQDASIYNRRLYTLNPPTDQIYRYEPGADGFRAGTAWLIKPAELADAQTLTIDGSIYVLGGDGPVHQFIRGADRAFSISTVDPALEKPTKLWTDENSKFLYILDPLQNRLVVFEKDGGALKIQYLTPALQNLKDFLIDEAGKVAYLLNGASVISIPLSHL